MSNAAAWDVSFGLEDDERDYAEEAFNSHTMHTGDGDAECLVTLCPYYVAPTIKCGCCKGKHTTVAFVKACYADRAEAEAEYLAEQHAERAYAEMLERRAEQGSWFGYGE